MSKVYFRKLDNFEDVDSINILVYDMIDKAIKEEGLLLSDNVPMKVHFGESGNVTFVKPIYYEGIKKWLKDNNKKTCYIETNVLYKGSRTKTEDHINTALEHGFNDLDIVIADSDESKPYNEIEVDLKHFKKCKIGSKYADYDSYIVVSHFKGHGLAGFGGAIKQLGMGFASRGGKMNQHSMSVPSINHNKCIMCGTCVVKCPVNAIGMDEIVEIDPDICIGCASCTVVCPVNAISNNWDESHFHEKLAEYAYAASKDKRILYVTYAFNITKECDCNGSEMSLIAPNIGIFVSTDPVSIDKACMDKYHEVTNNADNFDLGLKTLNYGSEIGLGEIVYELIEI